MASKNLATRRKVNAVYYDRVMLDPERKRQRREREARWRAENPELKRGQHQRFYERHREEILFRDKLQRLLMRVVRAEEARGRFE